MTLKPLREYKEPEPEDAIEMEERMEGSPLEKALRILPKLQPGEQLTLSLRYQGININNANPLQNFIGKLREEGIDVNKGDAQYGFKMPVPNPKEPGYGISRDLVIFRRR